MALPLAVQKANKVAFKASALVELILDLILHVVLPQTEAEHIWKAL